jgi:hypothetical protein
MANTALFANTMLSAETTLNMIYRGARSVLDAIFTSHSTNKQALTNVPSS